MRPNAVTATQGKEREGKGRERKRVMFRLQSCSCHAPLYSRWAQMQVALNSDKLLFLTSQLASHKPLYLLLAMFKRVFICVCFCQLLITDIGLCSLLPPPLSPSLPVLYIFVSSFFWLGLFRFFLVSFVAIAFAL